MSSSVGNIESQLTIHKIGGRNGTIGTKIPPSMLKETFLVLHDADKGLSNIPRKGSKMFIGKQLYCYITWEEKMAKISHNI